MRAREGRMRRRVGEQRIRRRAVQPVEPDFDREVGIISNLCAAPSQSLKGMGKARPDVFATNNLRVHARRANCCKL
jgi:hypothetical protein